MVKRIGIGTLAALAVTLAVWSTTFAGLRATLAYWPVGDLILVRWAIASAALGVYALATRMPLPRRRDLPALALAGFLGFTVYQIALAAGQAHLSAGLAGFLINLGPVFTALLAVALGRERSRASLWIGLTVAVVGMGLIASARGAAGLSIWALPVVLAAASFAGYVIVTKPLLGRYSPMQVTSWAIWLGSIPFLVFAPGLPGTLPTMPLAGWATMLYMALFPAALAYVTWARVNAAFPASTAAAFLYLIPVLSLGVAWVWIGEVPHPMTVAGGMVILAGVAVASGLLPLPLDPKAPTATLPAAPEVARGEQAA